MSQAAGAQRARGEVRLAAGLRAGATRIGGLRQSGSLKILFPHRRTGPLEAVLLNTAGGVTGGDRFDVSIHAGADAHVVVATQAAERIYRATGDEIGRVRNHLTLEPGARLDWLPQETIVFDCAALDRSLSVEMSSGSRFLGCEMIVFGRRAMGETISALHLRDRIDLWVDGALCFADRLRLTGDAETTLKRLAVANGAVAMATIIMAAPDCARFIPDLRPMLPASAGASALSDDLVVLRVLAEDSYYLRRSVLPILAHLNQADLPRTWMI